MTHTTIYTYRIRNVNKSHLDLVKAVKEKILKGDPGAKTTNIIFNNLLLHTKLTKKEVVDLLQDESLVVNTVQVPGVES